MAPMSAVSLQKPSCQKRPIRTGFSRTLSTRLLLLAVATTLMAACASEPAISATTSPVTSPTPKCSAPPPVRDIWKLEPMLTEQGLITTDMTGEQKERVIRDYIGKKNEFYLNCKNHK